jgi:hypothetical protein
MRLWWTSYWRRMSSVSVTIGILLLKENSDSLDEDLVDELLEKDVVLPKPDEVAVRGPEERIIKVNFLRQIIYNVDFQYLYRYLKRG